MSIAEIGPAVWFAGGFLAACIIICAYCLIRASAFASKYERRQKTATREEYWDWLEMVYGQEVLVRRPPEGGDHDAR